MLNFEIASNQSIKVWSIVAQAGVLRDELAEIKEAVKATERKGPAYKILQKVQKEKEAEIKEFEDKDYILVHVDEEPEAVPDEDDSDKDPHELEA